MDDDGNFNGMIGMLQRGEVDAATDGFALTESRTQAADPLTAIGGFE